MNRSDIHLAIKSYKRARDVTTIGLVPSAFIWVPESQRAEYEAHYPGRIIAIPDEEDGSLARKQNAILERTPCPKTLIMDDDLTAIACWQARYQRKLTAPEIEWMIERGFDLAEQFGVTLWGIQQRYDGLCYDVYQPFSLLSPILGPFHGHLSPVVRYDLESVGKDDYDFWLQTIAREHKTLRLEAYSYKHDHGKKPGGFVSMRSMEAELAGVRFMQRKWGKYYKCGGATGAGATGKNILNSRITIPLSGV
jgi:hypothetical protein